jgi:hypothetical protein
LDLASASLKTTFLVVATKEQQLQTRVQDSKSVDADLVEEAAKFLKGLLGLTIFGFDVVVISSGPLYLQYSYKPLCSCYSN